MYPEFTQTQDNKTQINMVGTPGLSLFTLGIGASNSPVRGLHTFNGVMHTVIDNKLYSVATNGTATVRGTLSTSSGRVQFSDNGILSAGIGGDQLMIVDGTNGYLYDVVTTAFSTISGGGWPGTPTQVEYLDGYFIVINGSMSYWVSNLYAGGTWNALATSPVSATSDNIQTIVNHRQQLFFIKMVSTEVWYNAGTPTTSGSPFQRVGGAVYDFGTPAKWSIGKGGSSFYFLCNQRTSEGGETVGVAEVTDYQPVIISPPAINYKISTSTTLVNCFGYCYIEQGHIFYVLTNPDNNWTIVYDATTKMWHERSSLMSSTTVTPRHLSNCYTFTGGKHYVGDYRNSNIYEMSSAYTTDNGNAIWSFRTAQTIIDPQLERDVFISRLVVDAETGVGTDSPVIQTITPYVAGWSGSANVLILADGGITGGAILVGIIDPQAYLSWSNDAGHTWSAEYPTSLGQQADYGVRLIWRRLGRGRNKVFKLRISEAVKKVLIGAYIEAGV
jgi:hypothetical protein